MKSHSCSVFKFIKISPFFTYFLLYCSESSAYNFAACGDYGKGMGIGVFDPCAQFYCLKTCAYGVNHEFAVVRVFTLCYVYRCAVVQGFDYVICYFFMLRSNNYKVFVAV